MLFQSQVPALIDKLGMEFYNAVNQARKTETAKRLNFYHDLQLERLEEQLNELFSEPEKMVELSLNIVKKIINNLAQVYQQPPKRTLEGTEKDQKVYADILERSAFDSKVKQAQRYTKLLKTIFLRPVWRNSSIQLDILTGNILDVVTGESPEQLEKVLITDYGTSGKIEDIQYSLWTPEQWQRLDHRGFVIDEQPNPYNVLPFVPCFDFPPLNSFWLPGLEDLISIQESLNIKLTDLMYLIQQQSFGVGYMKGGEGGSLNVDPGSLVQLPDNGEIGFVSQQAKISDVVAALNQLIKWSALSNGLSAASMSTEVQKQSGVSKQMDSKELHEMRTDDVALWRGYEKQLFNFILIVHNTHSKDKFSDKAALTIDFADPTKQAVSAKEQAEADDLKIAQGILSPVDILMRENPDITDRETALAALIQIRDEIQSLN